MSKTEEHFQSKAEEYAAEFWQHECEGVYQTRHDYLAGCEYGYQYALQHPHWIPVEEMLPPIVYHDGLSENHLVVDSDGELLIAYYDAKNELWFSVDSNPKIYDVTHWMPLPALPRKKD